MKRGVTKTLMPDGPRAATMPAASRVVLAPPDAWPEARLMEAARALAPGKAGLRAGDEHAGLVVVQVEPEPGAVPDARTVFEVLGRPRARTGAKLDVAVVLDAGGSMAQPWSDGLTRWGGAKQALAAFLREHSPTLQSASLLVHAKTTRLLVGPLPPMGIGASLESVVPQGPSRPADALDAALTHLAANASPGTFQAVLFLTDGGGQAGALRDAAARAQRLGVPVHALLFAPEEDALFRDVARVTGGSAHLATSPPRLQVVYRPPEGA